MRREWEPEELIACWTLLEGDATLVGNKTGPTRLGFALLLKFFELESRFPRNPSELPEDAVAYVAQQVGGEAAALTSYDWSGRTIKCHRAQIRAAYGFRESTRADEERLTAWLSEEVCSSELAEDRRREALLARCRAERIEPPGRLDRILAAAGAAFDKRFCAEVVARLAAESRSGLGKLIAEVDEGDRPDGRSGALTELKADPGQLGLETLMNEIAMLGRVRALGLPEDLFAGCSEKLVGARRARAARCYPSDLRASPEPVRHSPGRAVLGAHRRDHRLPRRPALRLGAQDQRSG